MKKTRKILAAVLSAAMLTSVGQTGFALGYGEEWAGYQQEYEKVYSDVPADHWAFDAISRVKAAGWFSGYPDGTFRPSASISREEAMTVMVKFLGLQLKETTLSSYYDVDSSRWSSSYIEAGKLLFPPVVTFDGQSPFKPEMPIVREDVMYAMVIAKKYNDKVTFADQSVLMMFNDANSISQNLKGYVATAVDVGLVSGHANGSIGAQDPLTRAEFASMLYRAQSIGDGTGGGLAAVEPIEPSTPATDPTVQPGSQTTTPTPAENGRVSGKVAYADRPDTGIAGAAVSIYKGGSAVATATTDANGSYEADLPVGDYRITATLEGYSEGQVNVAITADTTVYAETILLTNDVAGAVVGTVYDAFVQGGIIEGASITFRNGGDNRDGNGVLTVESDENGEFRAELPAGTYTAEAVKDGYITAYVNVVSQTAEVRQDISLTPVLEDGEWRFVLTWGEHPYDLDSHLTGPREDGSRFHVVYYDKKAYDGNDRVADLDVDDTTSYGPETVTIYNYKPGVYRYSVHDYTNRNSYGSDRMSNSGAIVKVYNGSRLVKTFNMPTNVEGTLWTVCEINNNVITPINEISEVSNPGSVASVGNAAAYDIALMRDLEEK